MEDNLKNEALKREALMFLNSKGFGDLTFFLSETKELNLKSLLADFADFLLKGFLKDLNGISSIERLLESERGIIILSNEKKELEKLREIDEQFKKLPELITRNPMTYEEAFEKPVKNNRKTNRNKNHQYGRQSSKPGR